MLCREVALQLVSRLPATKRRDAQVLICDTVKVVPGTGAGVALKLFNQ
jgi:hypothetical protein